MAGILIVAEVEVEEEVGGIVVSLVYYIFCPFLYDADECLRYFLYLFLEGVLFCMCALFFAYHNFSLRKRSCKKELFSISLVYFYIFFLAVCKVRVLLSYQFFLVYASINEYGKLLMYLWRRCVFNLIKT
jgi:heme O synthase-like polyprenyltransferase